MIATSFRPLIVLIAVGAIAPATSADEIPEVVANSEFRVPSLNASKCTPLAPREGISLSRSERSTLIPNSSTLGVDAWHAKGNTGRGIAVAVLDNGFHGYRDYLGAALPKQVRTKSFRDDGNFEAKESIHGLLCAECIHAIAPDAELVLANWEPDNPESFLRAVKWARQQGARIISCSMVMPGWSDGYGNGAVHRELAELLGDALFFASVGNLAGRHWTGSFEADGANRHLWKARTTQNLIRPWGGQAVSVELSGDASSTYHLSLHDDLGYIVGEERPLVGHDGHGRSIRFLPEAGRTYCVQVTLGAGAGGAFRLIVLGAELEIATSGSCMVFPGDGREVIAVGAVTAAGECIESSSTGWAAPCVKPEFVAPVPLHSAIQSVPFGGTSAAAPQAAGVAALLWASRPDDNRRAIEEILRKNSLDLGTPGPDAETGYGLIRLPTVHNP
jgi:subtilisin family serine protease